MHLFLKRPKYLNICNYNFLSDSAASKITTDFAFSAPYSSCSQNMHYMQLHNSGDNRDEFTFQFRNLLSNISIFIGNTLKQSSRILGNVFIFLLFLSNFQLLMLIISSFPQGSMKGWNRLWIVDSRKNYRKFSYSVP